MATTEGFHLRKALKQVLPKPALDLVRRGLHALKDLKSVQMSGPVVQIYVNDTEVSSFLGINNFFSFLLSDVATKADVVMQFYDENGKPLLKRSFSLNHFATAQVSVRDLFLRAGVESSLGLVAITILPTRRWRKHYRRMGAIAPHFFMFHSSKHGSLGHVHPLSILTSENAPSEPFVSNQVITLKGLTRVVLHQANPSFRAATVNVEFFDMRNPANRFSKKTVTIPPLGVRKIAFDAKTFPEGLESVGFAVDHLPSSNSKPVIFRHFRDHQFSLSHS